ncbi:zinc ABC transporter substrate-binding protein [Roseibium sp. MMSF_3412]|uniref:zinc ABC transporter substrate-binding protein n=1 Tax=Roseibium sp. MMSF_3412 TaxID=3046712 RepID=UPI00273E8AB9|nr:zinc ABC transporter substrate-binding protein [Roseibium sp. MMSF_3412]
MEGVGEPEIIIDGAASPHGFALKPSQAALIQGADVVFWVGPSLSSSLAKPIEAMAADAVEVELLDAKGIDLLPYREGANFDAHDHDHGDHEEHADHDDHDKHEEHAEHDHDEHDHEKHADHDDHDHEKHEEHAEHDHDDHEKHADHDDHDHDKHEEHAEHDHDEHDHEKHADHDDHDHDKHEEHAEHDHDEHDHEKHAGHDDHHGHDHAGGMDPHIWLNPDNGIAIAAAMAETLSEFDPDNAATYKQNAAAFAERIEALEGDLAKTLEPAKGKNFVVFHDAYHYFEHHFDFEASGAITLTPETVASASRVAEIKDQMADLEVTCVFQEPQFEAKLVDVVLEGTDARKGTLDPLGTGLENGPDLYPDLLTSMSQSLADCLSGQS